MAKSLVIGAGSMGLFLQYLIQDTGAQLIARDSSYEILSQKPLVITGVVESTVRINCLSWSKLKEIGPDDPIFIGTKAHELDSVVDNLKPYIHKTNPILLMQNGLGIYDQVQMRLPDNPLLRLLCYIGVQKKEADHIHVAGIYQYELAGTSETKEISDNWQKILLAKGITTTTSDNVYLSEWQKALWNLAINGLCAIVNQRNGVIVESDELNQIARGILEESAEIAKLEGIHLTTGHIESVFKSLARTKNNINATLQDLRSGRHPELEYLNGAVAKIAAKHGRRAPFNETIFKLVTYLDKAQTFKENRDARDSCTKGSTGN